MAAARKKCEKKKNILGHFFSREILSSKLKIDFQTEAITSSSGIVRLTPAKIYMHQQCWLLRALTVHHVLEKVDRL